MFHFVRDLDASSGGPSRSVPALAEQQTKQDSLRASIVFGSSSNRPAASPASSVRYIPVDRGFPKQLLAHNPGSKCLFHIHGLWSPLLHRAIAFAQSRNIPYVVSTRGMMSKWAMHHKAFKKRLAWKLYQKQDLHRADRIIASSMFEKNDVRDWIVDGDIDILPNGCFPAPKPTHLAAPLLECGTSRWALALGRLHPVKGYRELIEAWAELAPSGWKLAIAGPDEANHLAVLKALVESRKLNEQVVFLGAVDDEKKWLLLEQCELFLAPSRTENFGMAIAEALQSGTPVIATRGTPWDMLPDWNCGWWIALDHQALKSALAEATSLNSESLMNMGKNGQSLISEHFTWDSVATKSLEIYQSVLEQRKVES